MTSIASIWALARNGELRRAQDMAHAELAAGVGDEDRVELHLVGAASAMRQGDHEAARRDLDAAQQAAAGCSERARWHVETWRAELAYFQGRYSDANEIVARVLPQLERRRDAAYAAFALRVRIAILLAQRDYDGIAQIAGRARRLAEASGDDYVLVQVLNVLGAAAFDRATSKLGQPHARAHLSALDPRDTALMEGDAREALLWFERARTVAERSGLSYAAWYVAGNIERLKILLGRAREALPAIRKRLRALQSRGARYDEIVTRSNLAWALRLLGRHQDALQELDAAMHLVRDTRTANVLLEFIEYDRSLVLDALGQKAAARAGYRRYLALVGASDAVRPGGAGHTAPRRPLEPYFLKRADRYVMDSMGQPFTVVELAASCGVSLRTLEKAFRDYRGLTPVQYARNQRLDQAHSALRRGGVGVAEVAARFGFRSSTTFALEYRKRFGAPPARILREGR